MSACLSRLLLPAVNALQPIRGGHGPQGVCGGKYIWPLPERMLFVEDGRAMSRLLKNDFERGFSWS